MEQAIATVGTQVVAEQATGSFVVGTIVATTKRTAKVELADGSVQSFYFSKLVLAEGDDNGKRRIAADYTYTACKSAAGRNSCDNGDKTASDLRGKTLAEAYALIAKTIGVPKAELVAKYEHLNPGHQRMCIGNRLRGFLKSIA